MFNLYIFFSDVRDAYENADDNDSANILDMCKVVFEKLSNQQLLKLRDGCYLMMAHLEKFISERK